MSNVHKNVCLISCEASTLRQLEAQLNMSGAVRRLPSLRVLSSPLLPCGPHKQDILPFTHIVGCNDQLDDVLRVLIQDFDRGPGYQRGEILSEERIVL